MRHHPDDAHALVLNRILALPRGSEAGNVAHMILREAAA